MKKNKLAERLFLLRKDANLTQKELAEKLGLNSVTYLHYEKGQREPPLDLLIQISEFYDVTVDYLVGKSEY